VISPQRMRATEWIAPVVAAMLALAFGVWYVARYRQAAGKVPAEPSVIVPKEILGERQAPAR
jgi:hypothetical protein